MKQSHAQSLRYTPARSSRALAAVIASSLRTYTLIECSTRGKSSDIACGDRVTFQHSGDNSGVIESILPRSNLLYRSDAHKQKLIAANVTQVVIVIAACRVFMMI